MDTLDTVTRQGLSISSLFVVELVISAVLLALVIGVMAIALVRFRARPGETAEPPQVHGNRQLEIIWTATPAVTLAVMFVLVVQTLRTVDAAQPSAVAVTVTAHQWWWAFAYTDQQAVTANELHVPVGTPLLLNLESADVIHSLHVVRFGWMQDLVPGKTNTMQVLVDRTGIFDGSCNQYCGVQHAWMRLRVIAEPIDQFNGWVGQQRQPALASTGLAGEQVFLHNTCVSCHTIRGLAGATGTVGPDLTHVGSRNTLGAGVIDNTPENLRSWISNPQAIKPGVLMPAYNSLKPADLSALAEYLEALK